MLRRSLTSLTASFAAATFSVGLLVATPGVAQAAPPSQKTTFLGLEGADEVVSSLSDAIRWDLNQRGMDDGNTMSLAELKMTMGCGDGDLACYAEGGKVIESKVLVFGEVLKSGEKVFGDGVWRYQKPMERPAEDRAHLAGFDPEKAPEFRWRDGSSK